jgi:peptidyl-prolyl cis-trans isomerase B (cyclophilin B)
MKRIAIALSFIAMAAMAGCKMKAAEQNADNIRKVDQIMTSSKSWVEPKEATVDVNKKYTAVIHTSKGDIHLELFAKDAPLSVTNFKYLAGGGFYNGLTFHRVVPGFVIQGGDPAGTGAGGPGYTIRNEISDKHKHIKGALAWARTGDEVNPDRRSSGSQFYITLDATSFLDGAYTVFGQTTKGMDVVESIAPGDIIETIEVKEE